MATINTSSTNQIYLAYRDAGPSLDLIVPASVLYLVAVSGVLMNSFVVTVTVRTSSLRGTANFLMALICFFEVVHQSGHTLFFVVAVSGINFVSLLTADLFMTPMLFGANANMIALLSAALDRLFAVAFPYQHKKLTISYKWAYLCVHTLVCVLFGLYSLSYTLQFAFLNPGIPTSGCISETLSGVVGDRFFLFTTVLNLLCIFCYLLIWLLIRCKNGVSKETNTRLLRSLVVIMLVSIGGYLVNLSIYQVVFAYSDQLGAPIRAWQFAFIAGVLLNMGAAANAPILFLNSVDYRTAFKRTLGEMTLFLGIDSGTSTVTPMVNVLASSRGNGPLSTQLPVVPSSTRSIAGGRH